jgi:hypothetical protein
LFAGRKIIALAVQEYLKACSNAEADVRNVEFIIPRHREMQQQREQLEVERCIRASQRGFRVIPEVETRKQQYDQVSPRCKFLVLDGPSRMGKTRYTLSFVNEEAVLSRRDEHQVILFDEAHASMVVRCKKLFQASSDVVQMATSATNMRSYQVWAHRVRMVVATNRWRHELHLLEEADRLWLMASSVDVVVDTPLFLQ